MPEERSAKPLGERYAWFPSSLDDELPYSMLARYKRILGLPADYPLKENLGLPEYFSATFPVKVARFVALTQAAETCVDAFLARHTVYPYVAAFLLDKHRLTLREGCLYGFKQLSRGQSGMSDRNLAFCPECVSEDLSRVGQAAWRRVHQLPSVYQCPLHAIGLRVGTAPSRTRRFVACTTSPKDGVELECLFHQGFALSVARLSQEALRDPPSPVRHGDVERAMVALILRAGWGNTRGQVSVRFGEHLLKCVGAVWGVTDRHRFLTRFQNVWLNQPEIGARTHATSYYIFTLAALGFSLADFKGQLAIESTRDIPVVLQTKPNRPKSPESQDRIAACRARLNDYLAKYPGAGRSEVWRKMQSTLLYMHKNDQAWLDIHVPPTTGATRLRAIDKDLETKVAGAAARLLAQEGRPTRITPTTLGRVIRPAGLSHDMLRSAPLTSRALREHTETYGALCRRRLVWAARAIVRNREMVNRHMFEDRAAFPRSMAPFALQLFELIQDSLSADDPNRAFEAGLGNISLEVAGS